DRYSLHAAVALDAGRVISAALRWYGAHGSVSVRGRSDWSAESQTAAEAAWPSGSISSTGRSRRNAAGVNRLDRMVSSCPGGPGPRDGSKPALGWEEGRV